MADDSAPNDGSTGDGVESSRGRLSRRGLLQATGGGVAALGLLETDVATASDAEQLVGPDSLTATNPGATVTDGRARFQVLTPTLIRLEYDADGEFEDRNTFFAIHRAFPVPEYSVERSDGELRIETGALTLRYDRGSGPFTSETLAIELSVEGQTREAHPEWKEPNQQTPVPDEVNPPSTLPDPGVQDPTDENLQGWYRALDNQATRRELHDGLLSTRGWYLLDDTTTVLLDEYGQLQSRPQAGSGSGLDDSEPTYQDGYFFGYGRAYKRALVELADLVGAPPLLPRKAFGNWYSRWHPHSAAEYRSELVPTFREEGVPLDVLVVDTDWKQPNAWNGWNWDDSLFPAPGEFVEWAHDEGLLVTLNTHPSIASDDPKLEEADRRAGGLIEDTGRGGFTNAAIEGDPQEASDTTYVWDWADDAHRESFRWVHESITETGIDFWWPDWCCDESKSTLPGLPPDTLHNAIYTDLANLDAGRAFTLSRIGSSFQNESGNVPGPWADRRTTVHFTGDTAPTWEMLDFEIFFTVAEGNAGFPYVSHDIGSFHGPRLPEDMYVRWVQFGTFQPILRLHSNDGQRLPWQYEEPARSIATEFLRLRHALVPYLYSLARVAHDTGVPMCRGTYLEYPTLEAAYEYDRQYLLGEQLLVAPIASPGPVAGKEVWFPPGIWIDYFTGETYEGPDAGTITAPLERIPVFVPAGGIVPLQPYMDFVGQQPVDPLRLRVGTGADGSFDLYEDEGAGNGFQDGASASTPISYTESVHQTPGYARGDSLLSIGPQDGSYPGRLDRRGYDVEFLDVEAPTDVRVDGRPLDTNEWEYDPDSKRLTVSVDSAPVTAETTISFDAE